MNRIVAVLCAVLPVLGLITSCNEKIEKDVETILTAKIQDAETKTFLSDASGSNLPLRWEAGDVFVVAKKSELALTGANLVNGADTKNASFSVGVDMSGTSEDDAWYACYPAGKVVDFNPSDSTFTINLPSDQTYCAPVSWTAPGTSTESSNLQIFKGGVMPMAGKYSRNDNSIAFHPLLSAICFGINTTREEVTISGITLTIGSGKLCGSGFKVKPYETEPSLDPTDVSDDGRTLTLSIGGIISIGSEAKYFTFAIPPVTVSSDNIITIEIAKTAGGSIFKTICPISPATLAAGTIYKIKQVWDISTN